MISQGKRFTSSTASAVLPDAVGPMRKIAGGGGETLISKPSQPCPDIHTFRDIPTTTLQDMAVTDWVYHRPRKNNLSNSAMLRFFQVGRPWLHWSARGVRSISRNNAFISASVSSR